MFIRGGTGAGGSPGGDKVVPGPGGHHHQHEEGLLLLRDPPEDKARTGRRGGGFTEVVFLFSSPSLFYAAVVFLVGAHIVDAPRSCAVWAGLPEASFDLLVGGPARRGGWRVVLEAGGGRGGAAAGTEHPVLDTALPVLSISAPFPLVRDLVLKQGACDTPPPASTGSRPGPGHTRAAPGHARPRPRRYAHSAVPPVNLGVAGRV